MEVEVLSYMVFMNINTYLFSPKNKKFNIRTSQYKEPK